MKKLHISFCLALVVLPGIVQAQKVKIFQTKISHYDYSSVKGIVFDVSPQGVVLLDKKTVSAMSANDIQASIQNNHLPTFTVPFKEIRQMNIKRRRGAGKGFGLGYLASFVTLETVMVASTLSSNKIGCDGSLQKATLGDAVIGASCAAPPGIFVIGIASFIGGGVGSIIGSIPIKQISLDSQNPETDAREKLQKYALVLQMNRTISGR